MNISKFVATQETTIDTVKYYIKLGLLTPEKKHNWYVFSEKEGSDFQNISELKALGLSLELIKEIKDTHEQACGTAEQLERNLVIISQKLAHISKQKEELVQQEDLLIQVKTALIQKIDSLV